MGSRQMEPIPGVRWGDLDPRQEYANNHCDAARAQDAGADTLTGDQCRVRRRCARSDRCPTLPSMLGMEVAMRQSLAPGPGVACPGGWAQKSLGAIFGGNLQTRMRRGPVRIHRTGLALQVLERS